MHKRIVSRFATAIIAAATVSCLETGFADRHTTVDRKFLHPDRIRYDSRSLIINGEPVFIFSGELHYFRCPPELWKDRMQKMKDAGLNCVDTYLAWNLHEPEEPAAPDDFSKLRDMEKIGDFIQTAQDLGLYVMLRPGPYICAELDRGGLPAWLMKYRPKDLRLGQFLRGSSAEMLAWDRHWFTAAARVVKPHLITNVPKGETGVILWQLENEYDWNGGGLSSETRADVLRELAHASIDNGIDVPLFTCETKDETFREDPFLRSHVFDTTNKYPGFDMQPLIEGIESRDQYQPETFRGVTELQGGWFSQVGGTLSSEQDLNAAQITQVTLTAIERGCTSINYYMFYGGSNFGRVAARTLTQTYDYNAPLREWDGQEDRYYAVKAIGLMLRGHGLQLIHSDPAELTIVGDHKDVSIFLRRSDDGSQFFFVRNSKRDEPRSATVKVRPKDGPEQILTYNLGNFEAKVLYVPPGASDLAGGQWLPKTVPPPEATRSKLAAAPVPVSVVSISREKPMDSWREAPTGKHLVSAGVYDQRYVHYRANFNLNADEIRTPLALFVISDGGGDSLAASVNGTEVPVTKDGHVPLDKLVREGANTAEILFENLGCSNFGAVIELEQGITQISLVPQAARSHALKGWRMKLIPANSPVAELAEVRANFDDHEWQPVRLDEPAATTPAGKSVVYRTTLTVSPDRLDPGVVLTFPVIDDSEILFVNGQDVGRADDWSRPWTFDITKYLHEGDNNIALLVHNDWGDGGILKGCKVDPIGRVLNDVQVSPATSVAEEPLDTGQHRRLLVHYAMEFQLPSTPAARSVPWKLHLEADANAFVTLNGHLLGRYWSAGPQQDVWLPECWLNIGPDANNVIELQARPTTDAPVGKIIKQAEVRPYDQATDAMPIAQ